MADYYSILELKSGASKDEIKKAYRRLAMQWHPDKNPAPEARQKFILLTEAYDGLMSGKTFSSFIRTGQRAQQEKPKPKTREDLWREKMMTVHEAFRKKFMDLRKHYRKPDTIHIHKQQMYGEAKLYFILSALVLLAGFLFPVLTGQYSALVISFPLGLGFGLRIFWAAGRKKMKADMIFGEEENYSLEELRDFFAENPDIGLQPWGGRSSRSW